MAGLQSERERERKKKGLPCFHDNMEPVMVMMVDGRGWDEMGGGWMGGGCLLSLQLLSSLWGFQTEALRRSTQASSCVTARPSWKKQQNKQNNPPQTNKQTKKQTHQNNTNMTHWERNKKIKLNNPAITKKITDVTLLYTNSKAVLQGFQKWCLVQHYYTASNANDERLCCD